MFIAGKRDWVTYQVPGSFERMRRAHHKDGRRPAARWRGYWVQQEQPEQVIDLLPGLLRQG